MRRFNTRVEDRKSCSKEKKLLVAKSSISIATCSISIATIYFFRRKNQDEKSVSTILSTISLGPGRVRRFCTRVEEDSSKDKKLLVAES